MCFLYLKLNNKCQETLTYANRKIIVIYVYYFQLL